MRNFSEPSKIVKVLVAEDSPTSRRLLVEVLSLDPEIVVVGEACNGREAVEMAARLNPDVVTMDVTMPEMDGFEAMKRIIAERPVPVVIITSHVDAGQLSFAMKALRAGALTVVARPPGPGAPEFEQVAREIQRTVKQVANARVVVQRPPLRGKRPALLAVPPRSGPLPRLLAIATSAGGPPALATLLAGLTPFRAPIVIVQHISDGFVAGLAGWLTSVTQMPVRVASNGERLVAGTAYLAPDGAHLLVSPGERARLDTTTNAGRFRPSADMLLSSVAESYKNAAIGVILTGMGNDGVAGAQKMRDAGARVIVQDPMSAAVTGMPESAVQAGVASSVIALENMASFLRALFVT